MKAGPLILLAVLAAAACGSEGPVLVRLDMPGVSPFQAGDFDEIIVSDFRNDAPLPDLDPGLELRTYLAAEIRRAFPGKVAVLPRPAGDSPAAWREAAAGHGRAVFVTGAVRLESQIRKAVEDKAWADDPFRIAKRTLIEQLRWTLVVDLEVVSAATGELLFRKTYTENRDYTELDKPADFAFSDLAYVFREHLFPTLLGTTTIESRTLLRR
ncbi:MAG TPA: hypothetical protein P5119_02370 [Candidatus Aminicenantes bacterium]|nr:hypothetical protein [Candidatus Aminicenantes bacterium]HRY64167.1 hypothetical protein [Candidatus Aminicenantes bacterium]HRZ71080.1 hypothetical protein [Candidatus Aminicenantes bacterium]